MLLMEDTIAAIATALGEAALSVIRVSGPGALAVVDKCFSPVGCRVVRLSEAPSHTVHFGHIVKDGRNVDEVLAAVMKAPRTFTREDVVEIACHGGPVPAMAVLEAVLHNGARLAHPGEFTKRAFLNGRIDLAQAEAVMDLIQSRTRLAMVAATEQLAGKLSQKVESVRTSLMTALAHVEACIDFPEEDITLETSREVAGRLQSALESIHCLLSTAHEGRVLRRGVRAAIIGRPNAGKSSLLNQLLGLDRAIVSEIAGTTRDTIEETANILGIPVILIDTAGLRDAGDEIEREGMRRTRAALGSAELILHVVDASEELSDADVRYLDAFSATKRILIRNKTDLPERLGGLPPSSAPVVNVSCSTGQGIYQLKLAIKELVWSGEIKADMLEVMINARHQEALSRAAKALEHALGSLMHDRGTELVADDLRLAVNAIGEITGKTTTEDLLDVIFNKFCIGK